MIGFAFIMNSYYGNYKKFKSINSSSYNKESWCKSCEAKDLPLHLWCNSCSESSNRSTREKIRPCCCPWVFNDDSKPHQIKHYYVIQEYFNNVL